MRMRAKQPMRETDEGMSGHREQRYIYGGERGRTENRPGLPQNRRGPRKRASTFNILLILFLVAVGSVLYINNIIVVNQLAYEVSQLQTQYGKLVTANDELQAEVNRKSSVERIGPMAIEQLGMEYLPEHPVTFTVDRSMREKATEIDRRWESRSR
jgi:cell division protein FtsL